MFFSKEMILRFMKLFFSFFLVFFLSTQALLSMDILGEYSIKTKGVTIGSLTWNLSITKNDYKTSIELKNKGVFSRFYTFRGNYTAFGKIYKNKFFPTKYIQKWETLDKNKYVELKFKASKVENLTLIPKEKELARIQYKKLQDYKDPISSFISILVTGKKSYTIDGRRSYLLTPDKNGNKILIDKYINIWADHKRNDLEYLEIQQGEKNVLPEQIIIKFKGSLFYIKKI